MRERGRYAGPVDVVVRSRARAQALRCAVCHDVAVDATTCRGCGTLHHPDCRRLTNGCPTLGCTEFRRSLAVRRTSRCSRSFWQFCFQAACGLGLSGASLAACIAIAFVSRATDVELLVLPGMLLLLVSPLTLFYGAVSSLCAVHEYFYPTTPG